MYMSNIKNLLIRTDNGSTECTDVPIINIISQSLADGSDIGNTIFTIIDEFQYYCIDNIPPDQNKCAIYCIEESKLRTTRFEKSCPKIVSVLIGKGKTAYEKLENIFRAFGKDQIGVDFQTFYPRVFFYAMVKYILGRVLYGEFNINILLKKNNQRFLSDLKMSRFCGALPIFEDPNSDVFGYDKYFKFK